VSPEIDRSDSAPRVRDARSAAFESAMLVHAAMAGVEERYYSRRMRQSTSAERFPAGVAGGEMAGMPATPTRAPKVVAFLESGSCLCPNSLKSKPFVVSCAA
jgi:hypothetical protein